MDATSQTCSTCNQSWRAEPTRLLRFCPACGQLAMTARDYALFCGSLLAASFAFFFIVFDLSTSPRLDAGPPPLEADAGDLPEQVVEPPPAARDPLAGLPPLPPPSPGPVPGSVPEPSTEPAPEPGPPGSPPAEPQPEPYRAELEAFQAQRPAADAALKALGQVPAMRAPAARIETLKEAIATLGTAAARADGLRAYELPGAADRQLAAFLANVEQALSWAEPLLAQTVENPLHGAEQEAVRLRESSVLSELRYWTTLREDPDFAPYGPAIDAKREDLQEELEETWTELRVTVEVAVDEGRYDDAERELLAFAAFELAAFQEEIEEALQNLREARDEAHEDVADELTSRVKRWLSDRKRLECSPCGGDGSKKCSKCRGTGRLTVINLTGGTGRQTHDCNRCDATGQRICDECEGGISIEKTQELIEDFGGGAHLLKKDKKSSIEVTLGEDLRSADVRYEVKYPTSDEYVIETSRWRWSREREEWMLVP